MNSRRHFIRLAACSGAGLLAGHRALAADPPMVDEKDPAAVALGYVAEPRCIFRQARKLPPGHTLAIRRGQPVPAPRPLQVFVAVSAAVHGMGSHVAAQHGQVDVLLGAAAGSAALAFSGIK